MRLLKSPMMRAVQVFLVVILAWTGWALPVRDDLITDEELAKEWLHLYNQEASGVMYLNEEAQWDYNTNLTDYNLQKSIEALGHLADFRADAYDGAMEFAWQNFSEPVRRQFVQVTNIGSAVLSPDKVEKEAELQADLQRIYSTAKVCHKPGDTSGKCYPLDPDLTHTLGESRDWEELVWAWEGWRNESGRKMPNKYKQFIQLQNEAAGLNGYADGGAYWRSWYEYPGFDELCADIWEEVKPFYEQLHAYIRRKLKEVYKGKPFPAGGHIPAHILGNMWAQDWSGIGSLVMPYPDKPSIDVTDEMVKQGWDTDKMFRVSEEFFTSLGLIAMPDLFWKKSMLDKPDDRDVVCHASAWDFYNQKDFRIKQCTETTHKWLTTTHHEMGHVEYFLQYVNQPVYYRQGGNPGFHEAIGDVMELSVSTPDHLHQIGLLPDFEDDDELDLNFLMSMALRKVAFLPFGYLIDQWRWKVFAGLDQKEWNKEWWNLRCSIQGVSSPVPRSDTDFDAGAKFHVPNNTPYIRYFVSHILQFQMQAALCEAAMYEGPLHRCDVYQSKDAGEVMSKMMKVGSSKPWPEILEEATGSREMSASHLMEYFSPLIDWLKEQNKGHVVGWEDEC